MLGSAAALVAIGGAQPADLPVNAKAIEYVKVCSLYGPGFHYIPGTDTCIRLGGYLRLDVLANANSDHTGNTSGANNRFSNGYTWRSRESLDIDTRTATEYGVVRTVFDATFSWTTAGAHRALSMRAYGHSYGATGGGATVYAPIGTAATTGSATGGSVAGGSLGVFYAFIQFAGFTIGKTVSQFSTPWTDYPGNNYDAFVGGGGAVTGVNQFTYTAQFGKGCVERTRRPRHDQPLQQSRVQVYLRTDPEQLVFRAVLLNQVPRGVQAAAAAQPELLEMALPIPGAGGPTEKLV